MTAVKIYNVTHREDADPLVRILEGKTYMRLKVGVAPVGGNFDVLVSTSRPDTSEEELRAMVMSVLVSCAMDMGSAPVLRALAEGCDRLQDGDLNDIRASNLADARVLEHYGMLRRRTAHEPKEEATCGYVVPGVDAWIDGLGHWVHMDGPRARPLPKGTLVYADHECTVVLRSTD